MPSQKEEPFPAEAAISFRSVNISESIFRGENLTATISLNVSHYNVTIIRVLFGIQRENRLSHSEVALNDSFTPGNHIIQISTLPGIWAMETDKFFALSDGDYNLQYINLTYLVDGTQYQIMNMLNRTITVVDYDEQNMFNMSSWSNSEDISLVQRGGSHIEISSKSTNFTNSRINTTVDMTGSFQFELNATHNLSGQIIAGENNYSIAGNEIKLNVVQLVGRIQFVLIFNSSSNQIELNFSLINRKKTLLVGIADDHWSDSFPSPQNILDEVNVHFEKYFNVSFVVAFVLPINYVGSTFLPEAFDFAINEFGERLNLPENSWDHQRGRSPKNMGLDILLINTNKTMSNYGMVIGDSLGGFNMAANAGGSLNANGFRLQPSWADNLFQHELSHIFGAPDRKTGEDPPSVMTKSETLEDLLNDLAAGTLWLEINNWLEEDLITMSNQFVYYEGYITL